MNYGSLVSSFMISDQLIPSLLSMSFISKISDFSLNLVIWRQISSRCSGLLMPSLSKETSFMRIRALPHIPCCENKWSSYDLHVMGMIA